MNGPWTNLIVDGFLFGFGFAIAQTLWSLLRALFHRAASRNPHEG